MKQLLCLLLLCGACFPACAAEEPIAPDPALDPKVNGGILPAEYRNRPLLWIPKLDAPKKLSGDLSDPVWKLAAARALVNILNKEPAAQRTEALVFCTAEALYIGYRCAEPKLDELKTDAKAIWENDEVEIFLEPFKDTIRRTYHQVILDVSNVTWHGRVHMWTNTGYRQMREEWDPQLETAVAKGEKEWTCELRIPFDQLKLTKEAREKKTLWRLNLYRARPAKGGEEAMHAGWAPVGTTHFHTPPKFGYALPEVFASRELVETIRRNAVPEKAPPLDPAAVAEVRKRIGELESDLYNERKAAADRLLEIAQATPAGGTGVKDALREAADHGRDPEAKAKAQELLRQLGAFTDDDDPLPDPNAKGEY